MIPHLAGQLLLSWSCWFFFFILLFSATIPTFFEVVDETGLMSQHWIIVMFLTFNWHSKFFSELSSHLSDFSSPFFLFELEFSAHLIHWVSDDSVFYEATAFFVFTHFD